MSSATKGTSEGFPGPVLGARSCWSHDQASDDIASLPCKSSCQLIVSASHRVGLTAGDIPQPKKSPNQRGIWQKCSDLYTGASQAVQAVLCIQEPPNPCLFLLCLVFNGEQMPSLLGFLFSSLAAQKLTWCLGRQYLSPQLVVHRTTSAKPSLDESSGHPLLATT